MTPGAHLVQVDQRLATVVAAYAGCVGRVVLQNRYELPGMIELVEHVLARCPVCALTAYSASFLELGVKVVQIRNRYAQRFFGHEHARARSAALNGTVTKS